MEGRARSAALALAAVLVAGCGDPLVVIGDSPGIVRIVAGIADSAGTRVGPIGTESLLFGPQGVAVGDDGVLYIADANNARILAVASSGAIEALVDRQAAPGFREPDGLALDGQGGLVVADRRGHRIWRLDLSSGELVAIAGTGIRGSTPDTAIATLADINEPAGVAVATDGGVYFSDVGTHRVRVIQPDGALLTFAGSGLVGLSGDGGPATAARLRRPAGLTLSPETLYIADSGNHRIRAVDLGDRTISTLAGTGNPAFAGDDGPAEDAKLNTPIAVAVSADGSTLFIADSKNHRIRLVNLRTLTIATFAGTGDQAFNGDLLEAGTTALDEPLGVTVSPLGFLYISDTEHHIVRRTAVQFIAGL